jgi:hypothetical protein
MMETFVKDSLIRIVSHLMADGNINKRYLRYNNNNTFLIQQFVKDFSKYFGKVHFITGKVNSGTPFVQIQNKKIIQKLLNLAKSYKSESIEIPNWLRNTEEKTLFVRSLFDDEGTVGLRKFNKTGEIKRDIHIALKSKRMIIQLKKFLQEIGIKTNKLVKDRRTRNNKTYINWVLYITGKENLDLFKKTINFKHPEKVQKLKILLNSYIRK